MKIREASRMRLAGVMIAGVILVVMVIGVAVVRAQDPGAELTVGAASAPPSRDGASTTTVPDDTDGADGTSNDTAPPGSAVPIVLDPTETTEVPPATTLVPPPSATNGKPTAPAVGPGAPTDTVPFPVATTSPAPAGRFDGLVTIVTTPEASTYTFADTVFFDVTMHNGLAETIHVPRAGCSFRLGIDPMLDPVPFGRWDGTASSILDLIDDRRATTTASYAHQAGTDAPSEPGASTACSDLDIPGGTDVHRRMAWKVGIGEAPFSGVVYARSDFGYTRASDPTGATTYVNQPIFSITVTENPLRLSSRDQAAAAAAADGRVAAVFATPGALPIAGGWYHAARWNFRVCANAPGNLHCVTAVVDAVTKTVLAVG